MHWKQNRHLVCKAGWAESVAAWTQWEFRVHVPELPEGVCLLWKHLLGVQVPYISHVFLGNRVCHLQINTQTTVLNFCHLATPFR